MTNFLAAALASKQLFHHALPSTPEIRYALNTRAFSGTAEQLANADPKPAASLSVHQATANEQAWHVPGPRNPDDPLERLKHPSRGGQNLGKRYERLERSIRGKSEYRREIEAFTHPSSSPLEGKGTSKDETEKVMVGSGARKAPVMVAGFVVPEEPKAPEPDECCMSGCAVCVHDLYAESLESYTKAIDALRDGLRDKGVPETEWPTQLLSTADKKTQKKDVTLSVFEQMELQIAARREEAARTGREG